jgi:glutathione S-transferase
LVNDPEPLSMLIVHHLGMSQSERVVWLMEELGLRFKLVWHKRTSEGLAPESFLRLHPAAMSPIIEDGDITLCESEAILPYICHRYGDGRLTVEPSAPNYPDYLYWMALNNNLLGLFFAKAAANQATNPVLNKMLQRREDGYIRMLELTLSTRPYLAGEELTCADIINLFFIRNPRSLGAREMPHTQAYVKRLSDRPALIAADMKAGMRANPASG